MNGTEVTIDGTCEECGASMTFQTTAVAFRTSPKRYCSSKCKNHASYIRRKIRAAQSSPYPEATGAVAADGWPIEETNNAA